MAEGMDSWRQVAEFVASSQSSADAEAEELLSISESEEAAAAYAFWVPSLIADTSRCGFERPGRQVPIQLVSACTGSFAEAAVLQELLARVMVRTAASG